MSERQACAMLNLSRSVYRYQAQPSDDEELREQLLSLASWKPRWGFRKMFAYLKNQGRSWNHKGFRRARLRNKIGMVVVGVVLLAVLVAAFVFSLLILNALRSEHVKQLDVRVNSNS